MPNEPRYNANINRDGLDIPGDSICHWVICSYVMFHYLLEHFCKNSLCKVLKTVSNIYDLNVGKTYLLRLTNILINNYGCFYSPKFFQEPRKSAKPYDKLIKQSLIMFQVACSKFRNVVNVQ